MQGWQLRVPGACAHIVLVTVGTTSAY
jgi:hypothetical protein